MSIIGEKDCIQKSDGTLICYDREDGCYYRLTKKMVKPSELDDEDILKLNKKLMPVVKADFGTGIFGDCVG